MVTSVRLAVISSDGTETLAGFQSAMILEGDRKSCSSYRTQPNPTVHVSITCLRGAGSIMNDRLSG